MLYLNVIPYLYLPNRQSVINVPATGEGTELVPRSSHRRVVRPLTLKVVRSRLLQRESPAPFIGTTAGHVDLVQPLIDGQEGRLQLVLGVLLRSRIAARVVVGAVLGQLPRVVLRQRVVLVLRMEMLLLLLLVIVVVVGAYVDYAM